MYVRMPANGRPQEPADCILQEQNKQSAAPEEKINVLSVAIANPQANNLLNEAVAQIQSTIATLYNLPTL